MRQKCETRAGTAKDTRNLDFQVDFATCNFSTFLRLWAWGGARGERHCIETVVAAACDSLEAARGSKWWTFDVFLGSFVSGCLLSWLSSCVVFPKFRRHGSRHGCRGYPPFCRDSCRNQTRRAGPAARARGVYRLPRGRLGSVSTENPPLEGDEGVEGVFVPDDIVSPITTKEHKLMLTLH